MTVKMMGVSSFLAGLQKDLKLPEKVMRPLVQNLVFTAHTSITDRTAVWSGRSLRNWIWTTGTPNGQTFDEIDNGDPGPTNSMALGSEPRRPPNQAESDASLEALSFRNPFQQFWFANNAENIIELEYGELPTPSKARQKAGMVRVTLQELLLKLQTGT